MKSFLNRFAKVTIDQVPPQDTKPIDWLDNKFVPTNEIWPSWLTGSVLLKHLLENTTAFKLMRNANDPTSLSIGFEFPMVQVPAYGLVPFWETFPNEVIPKFLEITEEVIFDYMPDMEKILNARVKMTRDTLQHIKSQIQCRGKLIEESEGRHFRQEYAFRLGFHEMSLELSPLDIEVIWE